MKQNKQEHYSKYFKDTGIEKCFDSSNKINNVYAKEVWNEAIETAARCVHNEVDAEQIRKLKK